MKQEAQEIITHLSKQYIRKYALVLLFHSLETRTKMIQILLITKTNFKLHRDPQNQ